MKLAKKIGVLTLASAMVVTSAPVVLGNEVATFESENIMFSLTPSEETNVATGISNLKEAIKDIPTEYDGTISLKTWEPIETALLTANELLAFKFVNDASQSFVGYLTSKKKEVPYTQTEYVTALEEAKTAVTTAKAEEVPLTALIQAIDEAEKLNADEYTGLKEALAEAKAGLSDLQKNNESVADISTLKTALTDAMGAKNEVAKLKEAIALAESKVKGEYTLNSYSAMMEELETAKEKLEEKEAYTLTSLTDKIEALVEIAPLKNELAKVSIDNEADYTASSLTAYKQAIATYKGKLNKALTDKTDTTYPTNAAIIADAKLVQGAAAHLVDIKEVKTLVAEAKGAGFVEADYTTSSWILYSSAKLAAESVLLKAQDLTDVQTQVNVNTAASNLKLEMYGKNADDQDVEAKGLVNIKELKALVDEAGKNVDGSFVFSKNVGDYMSSTWTPYKEAVEAANTAITTGEAILLRKAVPDLVEDIKDAEEGLVAISNSTVKGLIKEAKAILVDKDFYNISDSELDASYIAWDELEEAVAEAEQVSAPTSAIIIKLQTKITAVKAYSPVKELVALVEAANAVKELELMPSAWKALQADIAAVQKVIDAKETDPDKIEEVKEELKAFKSDSTLGEDYAKRSYAVLAELIADAKTITAGDVEESVYLTLQEAIRTSNTFNEKYNLIGTPTNEDKVELGNVYEALRATMSSTVVDKAALEELIASVSNLVKEDFLPVAVDKYDILNTKRTLVLSNITTTNQIVGAYNDLVDAIEALKGYELNAEVLAAKVAEVEAEGYIEYDYTVVSWAGLQQAIKTANAASSKIQIYAAYSGLDTAVNSLLQYAANSTDTGDVIDTYYVKDADKDTYTTDSWAKYVVVRDAFAEKLCTVDENGEATLDGVKFTKVAKAPSTLRKLEAELVAAYQLLEESSYSTLKTVIAEAETKVEATYTTDSWAEFVKALDAAKEVYENGKPSEVATAEAALRAAMGALETVKGWVDVDGTWFYYNEDGTLAKGWTSVNGVWYFLDQTTGAMATGWVLDGGQWYYMDAAGQMLTGWIFDGGQWYFMNTSGTMLTGWVLDGGEWYFINASGQMVASNWVLDNGQWYYINQDGKMATNTVIDGWEIGENGVATQL